ncbi:MAG: hypothetical protein L0Y58_00905, partial [Verrucomicrobia subdivision 3 bacterium]|nr:hypothetical protein [Limisphaerales bacterium]
MAAQGDGTAKQKPMNLKRPPPPSIPADRPLIGATTMKSEPLASEALSPEVAETPFTQTPSPVASFEALLSDGTAFNPDTQGAVGPNHLMVALGTEVRIQTRSGAEISRMSLDAWWAPTAAGVTNIFDPRIVYDPYGQRWIFSANNNPGGATPGLLLAVSSSSDPTGPWYRRFIPISTPSRNVFADSPVVGFNRHWIVLSTDTYTNSSPFNFGGAEIYVYNKTNLYANGNLAPMKTNYVTLVGGIPYQPGGLMPVITYDPNIATNYLVSVWDWSDSQGRGVLSIYRISGPVTAPVFTESTLPFADPWEDTPEQLNTGPQAGTANRVALGDSRLTSATFRGGTIQCAHTVFLPVGAPTRAAAQWWEFSESTTFHQGRIDDPSGAIMYAYPSLAANRNNDIVIGYTRFSTTSFPSAAYRYRDAFDPADTLRNEIIFKPGNAAYFRTNSFGQNLWGDWSATTIDPLNDTDFWTIQEYAEFPQGTTSRWGTWWAHVAPPNDLMLTVTDSPDPVYAGSNLTYTVAVTNLLPATGVGRHASGVVISNVIPPGFSYVSATASQGSCGLFGNVVRCDLGNLDARTRATATIVLRPNIIGTVQNSISVYGNGPEADAANNRVTVSTMTLAAADLAVLVNESADPITVGSNLIYTVLVTNRGPAEASFPKLTNNLPVSCTFVSAVSSSGTCANSGSLVTCNLANIPSGGIATVTITARPNTGGITISNRASVVSSTVDADAANNVASTLTYVNARPTISAITNVTINQNTTSGPIGFMIGDIETPAANLTLGKSSSNPTIIPDSGVVFGGSGATRTVTVTPAPNQSGSSVISISVTDGEGITTTTNFTVTVITMNGAPTITAIADPAAINEDTSTPDIPFTIGDVDTPIGSLTVTGSSSNPTLVPAANINFAGIGADRTVRVTPTTNQTGMATITITVSDGVTSVNENFVVTVMQVNDRPAISGIASRMVNEDTSTGSLAFQIIDVESGGALNLSAISSAPSIVPTNNIMFEGTGTNRTVTVLP